MPQRPPGNVDHGIDRAADSGAQPSSSQFQARDSPTQSGPTPAKAARLHRARTTMVDDASTTKVDLLASCGIRMHFKWKLFALIQLSRVADHSQHMDADMVMTGIGINIGSAAQPTQ